MRMSISATGRCLSYLGIIVHSPISAAAQSSCRWSELAPQVRRGGNRMRPLVAARVRLCHLAKSSRAERARDRARHPVPDRARARRDPARVRPGGPRRTARSRARAGDLSATAPLRGGVLRRSAGAACRRPCLVADLDRARAVLGGIASDCWSAPRSRTRRRIDDIPVEITISIYGGVCRAVARAPAGPRASQF